MSRFFYHSHLKGFDMKFSLRTQQWVKALAFCSLVTAAQYSLAAGGFDQAKSMVDKVVKGIYAIVGIAAGGALLWQFVEGWSGRKQWIDVFITMAWIVGAGAALALATWLFAQGGKMSF